MCYSSSALTIALRLRPDLQVTAATGPATVTANTAMEVTWTVANLGAAATPAGGSRWSDGVYLSLNNQLDPGDTLLGAQPNGSSLGTGQSYVSSATYKLPRGVSGNAFLIFVPDYGNAVDQVPRTGPNYFAVPVAIDAKPVPPPDLVVTSVAVPSQAFDGTQITIRYHVANLGVGPTDPGSWTDSIWLTNGKDRPDPIRGDFCARILRP